MKVGVALKLSPVTVEMQVGRHLAVDEAAAGGVEDGAAGVGVGAGQDQVARPGHEQAARPADGAAERGRVVDREDGRQGTRWWSDVVEGAVPVKVRLLLAVLPLLVPL